MKMKLHEVVMLKVDRPADGLRRGMIGAVVAVHEKPRLAYEVEFVDGNGATFALVTCEAAEVEPATKLS